MFVKWQTRKLNNSIEQDAILGQKYIFNTGLNTKKNSN